MIKNKNFIKAIAIYQMVGGIFGLVSSIFYLNFFQILLESSIELYQQLLNRVSAPEYSPFLLVFVIVLCLYPIIGHLLSFVAGFFLFKEQKRGLQLSIIAQVIQVPQLAVAGFAYLFSSGACFFVALGAALTDKKLTLVSSYIYRLGSAFDTGFNPDDKTFLIGVNIVALFLLCYLIKEYNRIKRK